MAKVKTLTPDQQIIEKKKFYNLSEIAIVTGIAYNKLDKNLKCSLNSMSPKEIDLLFDTIDKNTSEMRSLMIDRQAERRGNL